MPNVAEIITAGALVLDRLHRELGVHVQSQHRRVEHDNALHRYGAGDRTSAARDGTTTATIAAVTRAPNRHTPCAHVTAASCVELETRKHAAATGERQISYGEATDFPQMLQDAAEHTVLTIMRSSNLRQKITCTEVL